MAENYLPLCGNYDLGPATPFPLITSVNIRKTKEIDASRHQLPEFLERLARVVAELKQVSGDTLEPNSSL